MPGILMLLALLGAGALIYSAEHPQTWPAARRGQQIAASWCAGCHQTAPDAPRPETRGTPAPAFAELVHRPGRDDAFLSGFLDAEHLPMPTFRLTDAEKADVLAYFEALRRAP